MSNLPCPPVKIWEEIVVIPTNLPLPPDRNPMFSEQRVFPISSGRAYPLPFTDRPPGKRADKSYKAVFLENEYLRLMVLPELGGRLHLGLDKTNGYHFVYHNRVIKPALISLAGPRIAGGIEWNWSRHPTIFTPVDYTLEEHETGSKTVWVGKIDPFCGIKGMVGITLQPGKSYFEAKVRLYNTTSLPQTFTWWASLGVPANENYQILYPPDVDPVADPAQRTLIPDPLTHEPSDSVDFPPGTDLSWYKNIPNVCSCMVLRSDFDFLGGYDHEQQAGVMHIANHHIVPGKKLFAGGAGDFSLRRDNNLTDEGGPCLELMTGAYTDNQTDYAWIQPYETKTFSQYWYPLRQTGQVKHANLQAAVNLEVDDRTASVRVYVTASYPGAHLILERQNLPVRETNADLAPNAPFAWEVKLPASTAPLTLLVLTAEGRALIRYSPFTSETPLNQVRFVPQPAYPPKPPAKIDSLERLYLRQGSFQQAIPHFQRAVQALHFKNFSPYDGESYYNLGLALRHAGQLTEAYQAFYKAVWSSAWQAAGYYALAELDCLAGNPAQALQHLELALAVNADHLRGRNLKTSLLRQAGRLAEAEALARQTRQQDPLDYGARFELVLIQEQAGFPEQAAEQLNALRQVISNPTSASLILAKHYAAGGMYPEAIRLLRELGITEQDRPSLSTSPLLLHPSWGVRGKPTTSPLIFYHLAYYAGKLGKTGDAIRYAQLASQMSPDDCFPSLLESAEALRYAQKINPQDARAPYYLGNLLYDKQRYHEAIEQWEWSLTLAGAESADSGSGGKAFLAIVHRNLGMAYFNIEKDPQKALLAYQAACQANPKDARLLLELDQLQKIIASGGHQLSP